MLAGSTAKDDPGEDDAGLWAAAGFTEDEACRWAAVFEAHHEARGSGAVEAAAAAVSGLVPADWTGTEVLDVAERHGVTGPGLPSLVRSLPDPSPSAFAELERAAGITGADFLHLAWAAARYAADVTHEELARAMAWSTRALWLGTTQVWELSGLRPATWASLAQSVPTAPTLVEHGLWRAGWRCLNDIDGRAFTPATPGAVSVLVDPGGRRRLWVSPVAGEVWSVARDVCEQSGDDAGQEPPGTGRWRLIETVGSVGAPSPTAVQIERSARVALRDALDELGLPVAEWADALVTSAVTTGVAHAADLVVAQEALGRNEPRLGPLIELDHVDLDEAQLLADGYRPVVSGSPTDAVLGLLHGHGAQTVGRDDPVVGWARVEGPAGLVWQLVLEVAAERAMAPGSDVVGCWRRVLGRHPGICSGSGRWDHAGPARDLARLASEGCPEAVARTPRPRWMADAEQAERWHRVARRRGFGDDEADRWQALHAVTLVRAVPAPQPVRGAGVRWDLGVRPGARWPMAGGEPEAEHLVDEVVQRCVELERWGWRRREVAEAVERSGLWVDELARVVDALPDPSPTGLRKAMDASGCSGRELAEVVTVLGRLPTPLSSDELVAALRWWPVARALGTTEVLELAGLRQPDWATHTAASRRPPTALERALWHHGWRPIGARTRAMPAPDGVLVAPSNHELLFQRGAAVLADPDGSDPILWMAPIAGEVWPTVRAIVTAGTGDPRDLVDGMPADAVAIAAPHMASSPFGLRHIRALADAWLLHALDDLALPIASWSDLVVRLTVRHGARYVADLLAARGSPPGVQPDLVEVDVVDDQELDLLVAGYLPVATGSDLDAIVAVLGDAGLDTARTRADEPVGWARSREPDAGVWRLVLEVAAAAVPAPASSLLDRWIHAVDLVAAEPASPIDRPRLAADLAAHLDHRRRADL